MAKRVKRETGNRIDMDGPLPDSLSVERFPEIAGLRCHQWLGAKTAAGYGAIWHKGRTRYAHHIEWLRSGRELPSKPLTLDHMCRNRACARVEHLRVATKSEQARNTCIGAARLSRSQTQSPDQASN